MVSLNVLKFIPSLKSFLGDGAAPVKFKRQSIVLGESLFMRV